jgi:hypothetical protein
MQQTHQYKKNNKKQYDKCKSKTNHLYNVKKSDAK